MPNQKRDLSKILQQSGSGAEPEIVRGQGYTLSTNQQQDHWQGQEEQPIPVPDRRSVRLRIDLAKKFKKLAVDEDVTMGELVERAMEEFLERYEGKPQ